MGKFYSLGSDEPKILEAFINEANLLREADHPNIIKVVDIYKDSVKAVIITEHCKGKELLERIKSEENLTENKITNYMKQGKA